MTDGHGSSFDAGDSVPGIALFFILEHVVDAGMTDTILELLEDQGHEILLSSVVERTQIAAAAKALERLSWERLAASGKVVVAVTVDLLPMAPDNRYRVEFPDHDNAKVLKARERAVFCSNQVSRFGRTRPRRCNVEHHTGLGRIRCCSQPRERATRGSRPHFGEFATQAQSAS